MTDIDSELNKIRDIIINQLADELVKESKRQIQIMRAIDTGQLYNSNKKRRLRNGQMEVYNDAKRRGPFYYGWAVNYGIGPSGPRTPKPFMTMAVNRVVKRHGGHKE